MVAKGGICYGCGAVAPKCKHPGCKSIRVEGGLCERHGAKKRLCTGFIDGGKPCPNKAKIGGLCWHHGGKAGMCPCGKVRNTCPTCKPLGRLAANIRTATRECSPKLNGGKAIRKPPDCLGCTGEELDKHLEWWFKQLDGISWDNIDEWSLDHILSFFKEDDPATTKEEIYRRAHYKNIQPMLLKDNLSKGNK